ncbi:hypothetical protein [Halorussus amylolyticus]|uniref:hypothetical protein n=1 Tax=Halorussus amylolyticus TaxID=1126242 RepID=UPI0010439E11|nr:hypothetical protein [Halorussus amylolyticus]
MNRETLEFWGGAGIIVLAGILLFAPLVIAAEYTFVLLVIGVLGLAVGALLVGLSQRGRAV